MWSLLTSPVPSPTLFPSLPNSIFARRSGPSNFRFSQTAILSNTGQVLAKSDGFAIETHEACDWARLFKNKKV